MRRSGILLHISSLPSKYGIGTLGKEAYEFVDFLRSAGQCLWQILPLGPTSYGDSPYQSPSTYAGNPYFIDFDLLRDEGLLKEEEYSCYFWGDNEEYIDYSAIYNSRYKVLRIAFERGWNRDKKGIEAFIKENEKWINDYGLFMAVKRKFKMKSFITWDRDIRLREPEALDRYKKELEDEINFNIYIQYLFYNQWYSLKSYANKKGIKIIGDIPIYVAEDSADAWANPEIFMLDSDRIPLLVAGCPPDAFSEDGQLWGNPLYNWDKLKEDGFAWWIDRIKGANKLYDIVRVDHFRAFSSFYAVKQGALNARVGQWKKAYGKELFKKLKEELPSIDIIAEDLGYITDDVHELMNAVGFPGMKILLFAFGDGGNSEFIPYKIDENSVAYIGTHDNDTFMGWWKNALEDEKELAIRYMNLTIDEGYNWGIIRTLYGTRASSVIVQLQDILGLDNSARMNLPSTIGENWRWRFKKASITKEITDRLYTLSKTFGRLDDIN